MDVDPQPAAEVIDLAAKFAEVARAANGGGGHEGGLGAPDPLAQLTRSLDSWGHSVQERVQDAQRGVQDVGERVQGLQYELHGVKHAADGLARRAQESEQQLRKIEPILGQHHSRIESLAVAHDDGAAAIARLDAHAATLRADIATLKDELTGLAVANATLAGRLKWRTWSAAVALAAFAGVAAWVNWPIAPKVAALLAGAP